MAKYQFYLDSCEIMDTRSTHEDTIVAGLGIAVNGKVAPRTQVAQVGDHNNGKFGFWEKGLGSLDQVDIEPGDFFVFVFELFNNGHGHHPNTAELEAFIDRDLINAPQMLALEIMLAHRQVTPSAPPPALYAVLVPGAQWSTTGLPRAGAVTVLNYATGGLFSAFKAAIGGCDGPLGMGLVCGTGAGLDQRIPAVGPLTVSAQFSAKQLGFDRPCNAAGSNYVVNVVIQRR